MSRGPRGLDTAGRKIFALSHAQERLISIIDIVQVLSHVPPCNGPYRGHVRGDTAPDCELRVWAATGPTASLSNTLARGVGEPHSAVKMFCI